ncbi:Unknown protein, partial [Striga hermonthica]
MAFQDPYELQMNQIPMHNTYHDQKNYNGLHYQDQCARPPHLMQRQEPGSGGFYPKYQSSPHLAPVPYHVPPPYNLYKSGPYMDDGMMYMDALETSSYLPNFSRHHPSCSYSDQYSNFPNAESFIKYHDHLGDYSNGRLKSSSVQAHARWPSDVNSEVDGFIRRRPPRSSLASGGRICRPIGCGAPFFTCNNCFELLLLPKNVRVDDNNGRRKKVTCGSCSAVVVFTVTNNKLVFSSIVQPEDSYNSYVKVENSVKTTFLSNDYENSSYDGSSNKSGEIKRRISNSACMSEVQEDNGGSVSKDEKGPVGLSLQDHFEYSNKFHRGMRFGEESKSRFPEMGNVILNENVNTNKQITRKESSATEIELSSNEYSNTGTTFDSGEASNEGDRLKGSDTAKMLLTGIGVSDSN